VQLVADDVDVTGNVLSAWHHAHQGPLTYAPAQGRRRN
jgi:hypothetical protein